MKMIVKSMACAAVLYTGFAASGVAGAQGLLESCKTDVAEFCSKVTMGNGRVMSCLYAHEDKLSEACDSATDDIGDLIDGFFSGMREAYATCAPDIEKNCSDVKIGQGRLVSCLAKNQATLGKNCGDIVARLKEDLAE